VRAGKPGRAGRRFELNSYVFTTFCGCRPAEPVSLTAVAMHQLLTQVLIYMMYAMRFHYPQYESLGGSSFTIEEAQELESLNVDNIRALENIVSKDSLVRAQLLAQGRAWSLHILEGPITWIMSAVYILVTVVVGATPLSVLVAYAMSSMGGNGSLDPVCTYDPLTNGSTAAAAVGVANTFVVVERCTPSHAALGVSYGVGILDALIYIFLPIWMAFLLRLVQGRPILHRVAGRSLLIGDVPWVAQTLEAFVSKTFALAYSIATISVASSNPIDHLVHRHTHRVVRGSLLAVGRPDGRLNALTAAEQTACLAINQASSIQNFGVTCESFSLGHNPFKLPLTAAAIHLPTSRRDFLSEHALKLLRLKQHRGSKNIEGMSASALMGALSTIDVPIFEDLNLEPQPARKRASFIKEVERLWGEGAVCQEPFIGAWMGEDSRYCDFSAAAAMEKQSQLQELYESRIASMQRLVGFLVLFHEMARRVQDFWPTVSCGLLGYDMSRSHSIMRIATTASPVSGSDVRHKMVQLADTTAKEFCASIISRKFIQSRLGGIRHRKEEVLTPQQIEVQIERLRHMWVEAKANGYAAKHAQDMSRKWSKMVKDKNGAVRETTLSA